MTRRVELLPEAREDLERHMAYIRQGSIDASLRFLAVATETFNDLAETPGMGPRVGFRIATLREVRKWPIHGFRNYIVFYRVRDDALEIVGVLHGAQNVRKILRRRR